MNRDINSEQNMTIVRMIEDKGIIFECRDNEYWMY